MIPSNVQSPAMKPGDKRRFSGLELLVLLGILTIAASIILLTVGRVRDPGIRSIDASNIRQLGHASMIYASDNEGQLPGLHLTQAREIDENVRTAPWSFPPADFEAEPSFRELIVAVEDETGTPVVDAFVEVKGHPNRIRPGGSHSSAL